MQQQQNEAKPSMAGHKATAALTATGSMTKARTGLLPIALAAALLGSAVWLQIQEPRHANHSLSEWLDAFDTNIHFPDEQPPRSGLTDEQIETALNAIGERALPYLLKWLQAKDSRFALQANALLEKQNWTHFRFRTAIEKVCLAETGFMAFATEARPVEAALIRLTFSPDADLRGRAFAALYFTRPEREVFLPVAYRGLKEQDPGIQAMSAQWLIERFPEEAEAAGMRQSFPQFYHDEEEVVAEAGLSAAGR